MKICRVPFNLYLLLPLLVAMGLGCRTGRKEKEASTLRVHLEVNRDGSDRNEPVPVYRAQPIMINVEKDPFLNEGNITAASVVDEGLGFAIQVKFNERGTRLLEMYSAANKGRHFAIFSQFSDVRWLAAPLVTRTISDGTLTFTPDATREEADRIVRGLNLVAKAVRSKW